MSFLLESGQVGNLLSDYQKQIRTATVNRWDELGLLEGLRGHQKETIAMLYENTASHMLNCCGNDTGAFETVAFPMIRRVFSKLLANELVSIQPLNMPSGVIFYYKPVISDRTVSGTECGEIRAEHSNPFLKILGECILSGTNCPTTTFSSCRSLYDRYYNDGLYDASKGNFTIMCATGCTVCLDEDSCWVKLSGAATSEDCGSCQYKLSTDGSIREVILEVEGFETPNVTHRTARLAGSRGLITDTEEFLASLKVTNVGDDIVDPNGDVIVKSGCEIPFNLVKQCYGQSIVSYTDVCEDGGKLYLKLDLRHPVCITCSGKTMDGYIGASTGTTFNPEDIAITYRQYDDLECATDLASVSFQIDKTTISVVERKMRACWTPEQATDLAAYHNIDAEAELTALLSETIANELDRDILRQLRSGAAFSSRWDAKGFLRFPNSNPYTQKSWNQTLITEINRISAMIQASTLRSGANFIVVSPEVSALFDDLSTYQVSNADPNSDRYSLGIQKTGAISGRYTVYRDPYSPPNIILIGYKSNNGSLLDTGFVFAPYVPISLTPTIIDPYNYTSSKAIYTRYATKMINNAFYGIIRVDGLQTFDRREWR